MRAPADLFTAMNGPISITLLVSRGMPKSILMSILVLMVTAFLTANEKGKAKHISISQVVALEEKDEFIKVGEITTDSKNNIYVSDDYAYSVKRFNPDGIFQHEFGRRGKQDGEFRSFLFRMICSKDTLAISELGNSRVLFFTSDGKFIRKFSVAGTIVDIVFDEKRRIYTSLMPLSKKNGDYVLLYDNLGRMVSSVFLQHLSTEKSFNMVQLAIDKKNNLIVAYHFMNHIEVFDETQKEIAEFTIRGLPDKSPAVKSTYEELGNIPQGEIIKDIAVDPKGNIFVLAGDYTTHPSKDVFVLDATGHQLTNLVLPSRTGFIYIDSQGFLYTREKERTIVKKYWMLYHGF
jgi:hypothetical protein